MRRKYLRRRRGAGMTEYIIIVFLIGIGAIGVVSLVGDNVRALFATEANALAGVESTTPATKETSFSHWTLKGGDLMATSGPGGGSGGGPSSDDSSGGGDWGFGDFGMGDGGWGGSGDSPTRDDFVD